MDVHLAMMAEWSGFIKILTATVEQHPHVGDRCPLQCDTAQRTPTGRPKLCDSPIIFAAPLSCAIHSGTDQMSSRIMYQPMRCGRCELLPQASASPFIHLHKKLNSGDSYPTNFGTINCYNSSSAKRKSCSSHRACYRRRRLLIGPRMG